MARCAGTTRDGRQCTAIVKPPNEYCYQHDPARSEERKRNASRAGKSTGGREIRDLKKRISEVVEAVLEGSQDRGRAAVAIQGFNSLRGVLELERKIREVDELEARIEQLEQGSEGQKGGRKWGA
jgi:hypothetical protein